MGLDKLAANNGDGEILQLLADAGAKLVDHDAALYLYRAYAVMGRDVKLFHRGKTETYQSHDDAFYHPDIFTVGEPFQIPDGTPPCVLRLINAYSARRLFWYQACRRQHRFIRGQGSG